MLGSYRPVLSVPGAPRLFGSALIARLPQGMTSLATLLLVRGATHSYAAAGVAVGVQALAVAAAAPPLGRLIDRFGRARVLGPCAVAFAVMVAALVVAAHVHIGSVGLVLLSAAVGAAEPPIAPTVRALMGDVFTDASVRERAYALESVAQELIWIVGPMLVALVIAFWSPSVTLLLIGAECLVGTVLFIRGPLARDGERRESSQRRQAALASAALRGLLVPVALTGTALGATEVGLPALALHAGSRSAAGLLLAMWSVGSMTGGLWYGARSWRASLPTRYATLLLVAVACTAPLMFARSIPAGLVCSLLAGATIAPLFSCQYALVGRSVSPGAETEAFTWSTAALIGGVAAGSAAGGGLVSAAGFTAPFVLACAATALAGVLALAGRLVAARRRRTANPYRYA